MPALIVTSAPQSPPQCVSKTLGHVLVSHVALDVTQYSPPTIVALVDVHQPLPGTPNAVCQALDTCVASAPPQQARLHSVCPAEPAFTLHR